MKIIGLEEHFVTADVLAAWRALDPHWQDVALQHSNGGELGAWRGGRITESVERLAG